MFLSVGKLVFEDIFNVIRNLGNVLTTGSTGHTWTGHLVVSSRRRSRITFRIIFLACDSASVNCKPRIWSIPGDRERRGEHFLQNPPLRSTMHTPGPEQDDSFDFLFKIILIGDSNVGKTCVVQNFKSGTFSEKQQNTIGVDFSVRTVEIEGRKVKVGDEWSLRKQ